MDNFAEQLVKKEMSGSDRVKKGLILAGGISAVLILTAGSLLMLGHSLISFVGLILAAGAGYGTFFLLQSMNIEYEYTFTNGELDIDKIIAKKKRKSLLSTDTGKFTAFGKYDEDAPDESDDMTVVFATNNLASEEYYADFPHEQYGSTRLVFCPDERMLENVTRCLSPSLRNKLRK